MGGFITLVDGISGAVLSADLVKTVRVTITPAVLVTLSHVVSLPIIRPSAVGKKIFVLNAFTLLRFKTIPWDLTTANCSMALMSPGNDLNSDDPLVWLGTFVAPQPSADIVALASTLNLGTAVAMAIQAGGLDLYSKGGIFQTGNGNLDVYVSYIEV